MTTDTSRVVVLDPDNTQFSISSEEIHRAQNVISEMLTCGHCITLKGEKVTTKPVVWDGTPNHNLIEMFDKLLACECCKRHSTGKPISIYDWKDTPWMGTEVGDPGHECPCDCRHTSRFIARQFLT